MTDQLKNQTHRPSFRWLYSLCLRSMMALLLVGLLAPVGSGLAFAKPRIRLSITPGAENTFLLVKVRRRAFARASQGKRVMRATLWVRRPAGWVRIKKRVLLQRRWTEAASMRKICRVSLGRTQIALQVGMRYGAYWWNRWTRKWQHNYISLRQALAWVQCPTPNDQPPGAPPATAAPSGPPVEPGFPTDSQPQPGQPIGQPPAGDPESSGTPTPTTPPVVAPVAPAAPPAPEVVSRQTFHSFYRSLKSISFSATKLTTLGSWLQGLGPRKVRAYMVSMCLRQFSFSSAKLKAARMLSHHVLRPLRAEQVNQIIKHFSSSRPKVRAALMFCRGIADPANIHLIANEFTFSSSKRKILRKCR